MKTPQETKCRVFDKTQHDQNIQEREIIELSWKNFIEIPNNKVKIKQVKKNHFIRGFKCGLEQGRKETLAEVEKIIEECKMYGEYETGDMFIVLDKKEFEKLKVKLGEMKLK